MTSESNPERYTEMAKARDGDECDESIKAFYEAVKQLRIAHKLTDVHIIIKVNVLTPEGEEVPALSCIHLGAIQEAEGMCGYAFARSGETRRDFVEKMKTDGISSAKRQQR